MSVFVSLPLYCPPDRCWVDIPDDPERDIPPFDCVPWQEALKTPASIIRCRTCGAPAIRLDCFYPYFSDQNRCQKCLDMEYTNSEAVMKAPSIALVKA